MKQSCQRTNQSNGGNEGNKGEGQKACARERKRKRKRMGMGFSNQADREKPLKNKNLWKRTETRKEAAEMMKAGGRGGGANKTNKKKIQTLFDFVVQGKRVIWL